MSQMFVYHKEYDGRGQWVMELEDGLELRHQHLADLVDHARRLTQDPALRVVFDVPVGEVGKFYGLETFVAGMSWGDDDFVLVEPQPYNPTVRSLYYFGTDEEGESVVQRIPLVAPLLDLLRMIVDD